MFNLNCLESCYSCNESEYLSSQDLIKIELSELIHISHHQRYLHAPLLVLVDGLLVGVEPCDLLLEQVHPLVGLLRVRTGHRPPVDITFRVARWPCSWIAPPRPPPWRNPRKGRDQILQRSVAEP